MSRNQKKKLQSLWRATPQEHLLELSIYRDAKLLEAAQGKPLVWTKTLSGCGKLIDAEQYRAELSAGKRANTEILTALRALRDLF